jgi:hypothetical protein
MMMSGSKQENCVTGGWDELVLVLQLIVCTSGEMR